MSKLDFLPVILGSDDNAYGVARSFHEAYGLKSIVVTKGDILPTMHSRILEKFYVKDLDDPAVFADALLKLHPTLKERAEKLILLASNENYVELSIRSRQRLKDHYILPFLPLEKMEEIIYKERFYGLCEENGLDYPKTMIFRKGMDPAMAPPFDFPVVVKPSDSVSYFNAAFPGKEKAYVVKDQETFTRTVSAIYASTYEEALIIQDYIPGGDEAMRVLNAYVDQNGKVRMMVLARVVLEDCTPVLRGNYVALVPEYDEEVYRTYQRFLEKIRFTGFANIDLKYDRRDGTYKIFELNIRQGRSSYFVTAAGYNFARFLVEDRIYHRGQGVVFGKGDVLWHSIPKSLVRKYVRDPELKARVEDLIRRGKTASTLYYARDFHPLRWLKLMNFYRSYHQRFQRYFKEDR